MAEVAAIMYPSLILHYDIYRLPEISKFCKIGDGYVIAATAEGAYIMIVLEITVIHNSNFNDLYFRVSATLPTGQLSNVPWRRTGVKFTNNEAYFDVIEEIDAIIDKQGNTVIAEVQGYVSDSQFLLGHFETHD